MMYIFTLYCSTEFARTTFIHQPLSQAIWSRIMFEFITDRHRDCSLADLVAANCTLPHEGIQTGCMTLSLE